MPTVRTDLLSGDVHVKNRTFQVETRWTHTKKSLENFWKVWEKNLESLDGMAHIPLFKCVLLTRMRLSFFVNSSFFLFSPLFQALAEKLHARGFPYVCILEGGMEGVIKHLRDEGM